MFPYVRRFVRPVSQNVRQVVSARYSTETGINGSKDNISNLVKSNKIVLFMKGTPDAPMCGFSNAVVQILKFHGVNDFASHDVLKDDSLREGIKVYSNWPTIPQVFMDGEFVGGCDIMLDMHKNGDLIEELSKLGIQSAVLDNIDPKMADK